MINLIELSIDVDQLLVEGAVKGEGVAPSAHLLHIQHYARVDGSLLAA